MSATISKHLAAAAAMALCLGASGCDKSKGDGNTTTKGGPTKSANATAGTSTAVKPAPAASDKPAPSANAATDDKAAANDKANGSATPPTAPAPAAGDGQDNAAASGGPRLQMGGPVAGMDLANEAAGVLTSDLKFGKPAGGNAPAANKKPDGSLVPVKTAAERHKTCQKLLDCTKEAVALAPNAVTSYEVTRESVDSLEAGEAAGECASDLDDLRSVLEHEKVPLPKVCK